MTGLFESIPISTLLYIAALLVYLISVKRITSFSFIFIGVLILEAIHQGFEYMFASLVHSPDLASFVYYSWYLSFAFTDFLLVGIALYWSKKSRIGLEATSKLLLWIYAGLGILQLTRLLERSTLNSELMSLVYSNGIPLANMAIAIILIVYVVKVVIENFMNSFKTL